MRLGGRASEANDTALPSDDVPAVSDWPVLMCLLGRFRVLKHGEAVALPADAKSGLLLRHLALHSRHGVSRERLLATLWPDASHESASASLNSLVAEVRKLLRDDPTAPPPILNEDGCYRLNLQAGVAVDVDQFDRLADEGDLAREKGRGADALAAYGRALAICCGDLYLGHGMADDVHAYMEQERLRSRRLTTLARAALLAGRSGDVHAAVRIGQQLLNLEPCSELGHRLMMHVFMLRGDRAQALRQYRVCAETLRREFDAEPEAASTRLFDLVRVDAWSPELGCGLLES